MTEVPAKIARAGWHVLPAPLRQRIRGNTGKRFIRFVPVAILAVIASQVTYIICIGPAGLTGGISGAAGWLAGAAVSYLASRWAWERRGRPDVLRETLPFWVVSISAGLVLTLASKLGVHVAEAMGLHGVARVAVADGFYFGANCVTFVSRFVIFHYVLFKDRRGRELAAARPQDAAVAAAAPDDQEEEPVSFALAGERPTEPPARR